MFKGGSHNLRIVHRFRCRKIKELVTIEIMEQAIGRAAMFGYAACTPHNIGSIHRDYCMNAIN